MGEYVLGFHEIDASQVELVGGKGARLGELSKIEGVNVPEGFCITTAAFQRIMGALPAFNHQVGLLSALDAGDRAAVQSAGAELRRMVEQVVIPIDIIDDITYTLAQLGSDSPCAVRSSATAEDSLTASFAGQQDTYLDVVGVPAILESVKRCWGSLFTERSITYRLQNGLDQHMVRMAVVVQRMVAADASGVLFTAEPSKCNRKISSIEAKLGPGEALVSGLINPDRYKVRDGIIVDKAIADKQLENENLNTDTNDELSSDREKRALTPLTDAQVVRLAELGRKIEAHFGWPQDIEWCLTEDDFQVVQSRPITTLFPVPAVGDGENHVYLSVGHQQMMTDAMKPLGISVWQLATMRPMSEAGGRLWVDVARMLATPSGRENLMSMAGRSDVLTGDALQTIIDRGDFIPSLPDPVPQAKVGSAPSAPAAIETDAAIPAGLIKESKASIAALKREIQNKSGTALLEFIQADIPEHRRMLFDPKSIQVIMAGIDAVWWLNDKLEGWLGEKNAADAIAQSVANNVTSEMGLALLDVADVIRPHGEVVAFLERVDHDNFLNALTEVAGGVEARDAIQGWLDQYGMRGPGEIDITRPRWSEHPRTLVPMLMGNIKNFEPGESKRRFEHGLQNAREKEQELLSRLRALPDGEDKAGETKRMIDRVRTFAGYREYPKYGKIAREFVYKQALMEEAERLVHAEVLREKDDIFYLRFEELHEIVRASSADYALIRQRKDEFKSFQKLTPPRVLTSDGECLSGSYRREDFPAEALVGLAISAGTVEGRARVILDMAKAVLEPGDILVTKFTDPSWTPLFVAIKGLVTEVGGLMTHGAVIAREYGLPAVVGVEHATRLIIDGTRIRVHGTAGYVEVLS